MTRDEVMGLTDEQLRIMAAELIGWVWDADIEGHVCESYRQQYSEPPNGAWVSPMEGDPPTCTVWLVPAKDCTDNLPDYPNDIKAAYSLGAHASRLDTADSGDRTLKMSEFILWHTAVDSRDEWAGNPAICLRDMLAWLTPSVITRAFILVMEDSDARQ